MGDFPTSSSQGNSVWGYSSQVQRQPLAVSFYSHLTKGFPKGAGRSDPTPNDKPTLAISPIYHSSEYLFSGSPPKDYILIAFKIYY